MTLGFITIIVSLAIMLVFGIARNHAVRLFSLVIITVLSGVVIFGFISIQKATAGKQGAFGYTRDFIKKNVIGECFHYENYTQIKRITIGVILRIDDIQSGAWNELSQMATEDAINLGIHHSRHHPKRSRK